MLLRIEGIDLPGKGCGPSPDEPGGYRGIHVGVQGRKPRDELLGLTAGDAPSATWTVECTPRRSTEGLDITGPYIQGRPGGRFIYLSWVTVDEAGSQTMFRRAKLWWDGVAPEVAEQAVRQGLLVGRLGLTDDRGNPICATVRPPRIVWSAPAQT